MNFSRDKLIAEKILSRAASLQADVADVFLRTYTSTSIEVKGQKVDAFDRAKDIGAGLRVLVGTRMGFAFTTDFSDGALRTLAQAALMNAQSTEPDPFHSFPDKPAAAYQTVAIYDPELVALSEKEKIDRVMAMEREAFAVDPRIKRIRKASAGFSDSETLIMNTKGAGVSYKSTACSSSIEVVAEERDESQAVRNSRCEVFSASF
jgi:PmbA protein